MSTRVPDVNTVVTALRTGETTLKLQHCDTVTSQNKHPLVQPDRCKGERAEVFVFSLSIIRRRFLLCLHARLMCAKLNKLLRACRILRLHCYLHQRCRGVAQFNFAASQLLPHSSCAEEETLSNEHLFAKCFSLFASAFNSEPG